MAGHEHDREALVQIGTADNGMIASLWRQVLDEEGIRSMVKPAGAGAGYFSPDMQPQLIYVLASDAERARAILAEMEEEPDAPLDDEQVEVEPDTDER
ncbi:MAG TPA: DUF2007 domain-containing protein [Thermomicrobiaceae bacterium]|nr:DUF2007 domain-containing protein [Thermomicrobiaceae bacterium]